MAPINDAVLGDVQLTVVPGTYKKSARKSGRGSTVERIVIDQFDGQRQAVAQAGNQWAYAWDGVGVGPAFDGAGVEPFPHSATFGDSMADVPSLTNRAHFIIAGGFLWMGLGRRMYKSAALTSASWTAWSAVADLGAGYTISGLAYFQDDLLIMLSTGQEIRKLNTATNALTIWRAGERGQVGAGYNGQLVYAPRLAGALDELRISGTKWNGNAETYQFFLDAPIVNMGAFGGAVIVATKQSLYRVTGRNYPGEQDDAAVTADTSKAPLWTEDPEPVMSHGQSVDATDFTFLASYRGSLFTWLGGRVAELGPNDVWLKHGPEGIACYGGCVAGDWLIVVIRSRFGFLYETWGYNGFGWWCFNSRDTPGACWPGAVGGAGNRDLIVTRDGATSYELFRLYPRSTTALSYASTGTWVSPLIAADDPGALKSWLAIGASFAAPVTRGNAASSDSMTIRLDYSRDAGVTWVTAASLTTTLATQRTFDLQSGWEGSQSARYLQLRVVWTSISDWAPVLVNVWAEVERPPELGARLATWELTAKISDRTLRRDAQVDPRPAADQRQALWDLWQAGQPLPFVEADAGLWTPALQPDRALWLQADQLSGLVEGQLMSAWPDASGGGPTAIQATAAAQPRYRLGVLNGRPVVRFGGDDWLTIASVLGITLQPWSFVALWKANGTAQALSTWASTGLVVTDLDDDVGISAGSALFNLNAHTFGAWHVLGGVFAGAGSALAVDGGTAVTGSAGSGIPAGSLTIGAGAGGLSQWLDGDLFGLVIVRQALTAGDRQRLEGYMAWAAGAADLLASNHPYKAAAPLRSATVRIRGIEEKADKASEYSTRGDATVALVLDQV